MAAPSSWGNTVSDYGKIGISVNVTYPTATTASVSIEVWVATRYAATDSNNNFWFDDNAQSASTSRGSRSIKTTVNSPGWSASNQQKIYTYPTFTVQRTTSNQTRHCAAKLSGVEIAPGTMTQSVSYTIKARDSYVISYSPNDRVCTVPASHKKYHGINTTVSSTVPTTDGYTCTGWISSAPEYKFYAFGAQYTADASVTLYANWVLNKYKITLRPNGGSVVMPDIGGVVTAETVEYEKTHGATLELPVPILANYNFLGWSTSATSDSVTYVPGATYTDNSAVTLYAVWELAYVPPKITEVIVERSDANGSPTDEGTHFNVSFKWETDKNFANEDGTTGVNGTSIVIRAIDSDGYFAKLGTDDAGNLIDKFEKDISGFSGIVDEVAVGPPGTDGIGPISTELSYVVYIEVRDTHGSTIIQRSIMPIAYPIDIYKEGKGIAFGMPAKKEGVFDVKFNLGDNLKLLLLDFFYPVNSIYISYSHANPGTLFGGTWVRIENKFLWGVDPDGHIGTTGGESTHVLTDDEMPTHSHWGLNYQGNNQNISLNTGNNAYLLSWTASKGTSSKDIYTGNAGGGAAHNNMPPYVQVSIWRRTA